MGNTPVAHAKHDKNVEGHVLEVRQILDTLNSLGLGKNLGAGGGGPHLASVNPHDAITTSVSESGTSLAPPSWILYGTLIAPRFVLSRLQRFSLSAFDQTRIRSV